MKHRENLRPRGGSRVGAGMGGGPHVHTLIYDGECRICRRSVGWVRASDRDGLILLLPYQDPRVSERFPDVPLTAMEAAMQLISPEGRRWEGAEAVERVLDLLPGWRVAAPLFRVPGVRWLAHRAYRAVARNRRRLGCGEHCTIASGGPVSGAPGQEEPGEGAAASRLTPGEPADRIN